MLLVCVLPYKVHTRPRVQRASGVPHALFGREIKCKTSGALRGEAANVCLVVIAITAPHSQAVIARESGRPSIPRHQ